MVEFLIWKINGLIMDVWRWIEVLLLFLYGFMINGGDWRRFWWKMGWNSEVQEFRNFEIYSVPGQHPVDDVDPLQRKHRKITQSWNCSQSQKSCVPGRHPAMMLTGHIVKFWKKNLPPSCLVSGLCVPGWHHGHDDDWGHCRGCWPRGATSSVPG